MWTLAAALLGLLGGEGTRRRLNRLSYRLAPGPEETGLKEIGPKEAGPEKAGPEETGPAPTGAAAPASTTVVPDLDETVLPAPGRRLWLPPLVGLAWAGAVWALTDGDPAVEALAIGWSRGWRLTGWLVFALVGAWLAAVDLDVKRLPDRAQALLAAALLISGLLLDWGHPAGWLTALAAAAVCGAGFLLLHLLSRGGLGLGDVKLVMTCAWWLALGSIAAVLAGLVAACLLAVGYSLIARVKQFAFGPWLVAGTLLAGLVW